MSGLIGFKLFDTLDGIPEITFQKVDFEKNQQTTKQFAKLPSRQRVNIKDHLVLLRALKKSLVRFFPLKMVIFSYTSMKRLLVVPIVSLSHDILINPPPRSRLGVIEMAFTGQSNFTQMFLSVRQCAELMTQLPRLKVKVTFQGHRIYP